MLATGNKKNRPRVGGGSVLIEGVTGCTTETPGFHGVPFKVVNKGDRFWHDSMNVWFRAIVDNAGQLLKKSGLWLKNYRGWFLIVVAFENEVRLFATMCVRNLSWLFSRWLGSTKTGHELPSSSSSSSSTRSWSRSVIAETIKIVYSEAVVNLMAVLTYVHLWRISKLKLAAYVVFYDPLILKSSAEEILCHRNSEVVIR